MTATIECTDCHTTVLRTGRNQKRCPVCAKARAAQQRRVASARWRAARGGRVGVGSGAHNTPGELHPQWAGGERKFGQVLAPAYYQKVRYCERCNEDLLDAPPAFRCVHHKDHNRKNNVESNFELLCKRCHQIEHECWNAFNAPR